jgi:hypothetical protein
MSFHFLGPKSALLELDWNAKQQRLRENGQGRDSPS